MLAALGAALQGMQGMQGMQQQMPLGNAGQAMGPMNGGWMTSCEPGGLCVSRMTVEGDKVGSVLGKRGANASQIRQVRPCDMLACKFWRAVRVAHDCQGRQGWQRASDPGEASL